MEMRVPVCKYGCLQPSPSPRHTQDNKVKRKKKCVFERKTKVQTVHGNCRVALEISGDALTKSDRQHLTNHHHPLILWVQTPSSRGSGPDICPAEPSCHLLLRSQARPQHCLNTSASTLALKDSPLYWHSTFVVIWSETLFELGIFRLRANSRKKTLRPVIKRGLIKLKSGHCCRFTVFVNNYPVLGVADWLERFAP